MSYETDTTVDRLSRRILVLEDIIADYVDVNICGLLAESIVSEILKRRAPTPGGEERDVSEWQPIETAPKDEMFIWARPKGDGKWAVGLAYRNVSGGWSDAYGDAMAPSEATLWAPMPEPPDGR